MNKKPINLILFSLLLSCALYYTLTIFTLVIEHQIYLSLFPFFLLLHFLLVEISLVLCFYFPVYTVIRLLFFCNSMPPGYSRFSLQEKYTKTNPMTSVMTKRRNPIGFGILNIPSYFLSSRYSSSQSLCLTFIIK